MNGTRKHHPELGNSGLKGHAWYVLTNKWTLIKKKKKTNQTKPNQTKPNQQQKKKKKSAEYPRYSQKTAKSSTS
jgi:hypothetical protein